MCRKYLFQNAKNFGEMKRESFGEKYCTLTNRDQIKNEYIGT